MDLILTSLSSAPEEGRRPTSPAAAVGTTGRAVVGLGYERNNGASSAQGNEQQEAQGPLYGQTHAPFNQSPVPADVRQ